MKTDWEALARQVGSLQADGSQRGGTSYALRALEEILGDEWVTHAVEHALVGFGQGEELAMNCLRYLCSEKAARYAYQVYKTSEGERARQAVWLIKYIAHPVALGWVAEFLHDENVRGWGIDVLDQLLWNDRVEADDAQVQHLLALAETFPDEPVRYRLEFIRGYLQQRGEE